MLDEEIELTASELGTLNYIRKAAQEQKKGVTEECSMQGGRGDLLDGGGLAQPESA